MRSLDIKTKNKIKPRGRVPPPVFEAAPRAFWPKSFVLGMALLVVLVGLSIFFLLPEAKISIKLRTEPVTRDLEIRLDQNEQNVSVSTLLIPGEIKEKEIEGGRIYSTSGVRNVGSKASGFVNLYNFSKTTLILKAETTVLTAGGKKYFFAHDVGSIRPTARIGLDDVEIDPSSLIPPVAVIAETPGEAYNLAAGTRLEITNEVFGAKPETLYAVAASDGVSGGATKEIKIATEADLTSALDQLKNDLVEQARRELEEQDAGVKILAPALAVEIVDQSTSVSAGAEVAEFTAGLKLKIRALGFSEKDVLKVIRERISRLLPENKKLIAEDQPKLQTSFIQVNLGEGSGILAAHFEGEIRYELDQVGLKDRLRGKTADEIREILLSRAEIQDVEVRFYPFWLKKAPRFTRKIELDEF